MSRIVLHSMAHRGDVFPYVPIASELSRRGHDVTFVVPREFHPLFESEPFRCVHSGTDFSPVALDEHGDYIARWGMKFGGAAVLPLYFRRFTVPHLDELFEAIDNELASADLLVSHPAAAIVGAMSCERRDLPWLVGDLFPMLVPTTTAAPGGMPNLGARGNGMLWRLGRTRAVGPLFDRAGFVEFRTRLGLATDRDWNVLDARLSPYGNFALSSRHYVERAPDWPEGYELVGFTSWHGPDDGHLADDVTTFLADGAPPVVVTLGTSAASARPEVFEQVAAVLDQAGVRGIFLTSNAAATEHVKSVVAEPHAVWRFVALAPLLAHARAVVHSGAHGTNALTLAAGLPSAIVPCMFDQLWHAQRQQKLGTGVWIRRSSEMPQAVQRLLSDATMRERARVLGDKIAAENGTMAACDAIEEFLQSAAA